MEVENGPLEDYFSLPFAEDVVFVDIFSLLGGYDVKSSMRGVIYVFPGKGPHTVCA